jgi:hypothetical protein
VVNVTNGSHIHVRLCPLKLSLCHNSLSNNLKYRIY